MPQTIKLVDRREIAQNVLEIAFAKPEHFAFRAGQHLIIKAPELLYEDARGPRRVMTISSAPHEQKITITTRMSDSGYKRTLAELPIGSDFEYIGPRGEFFLRRQPRRVAFLAGGIGITPFRSMLLDSLETNSGHDITLFYSNSQIEEIAYHALFQQLATERDLFRYVPTLTRSGSGSSWSGEQGRLHVDLIRKHLPDWQQMAFYLCGPPDMVNSLKDELMRNGIGEDNIFFEAFWGY